MCDAKYVSWFLRYSWELDKEADGVNEDSNTNYPMMAP